MDRQAVIDAVAACCRGASYMTWLTSSVGGPSERSYNRGIKRHRAALDRLHELLGIAALTGPEFDERQMWASDWTGNRP